MTLNLHKVASDLRTEFEMPWEEKLKHEAELWTSLFTPSPYRASPQESGGLGCQYCGTHAAMHTGNCVNCGAPLGAPTRRSADWQGSLYYRTWGRLMMHNPNKQSRIRDLEEHAV